MKKTFIPHISCTVCAGIAQLITSAVRKKNLPEFVSCEKIRVSWPCNWSISQNVSCTLFRWFVVIHQSLPLVQSKCFHLGFGNDKVPVIKVLFSLIHRTPSLLKIKPKPSQTSGDLAMFSWPALGWMQWERRWVATALLRGDAVGERDTPADFSICSQQICPCSCSPCLTLTSKSVKKVLVVACPFCPHEDKKGFFAGRISISYK